MDAATASASLTGTALPSWRMLPVRPVVAKRRASVRIPLEQRDRLESGPFQAERQPTGTGK